MTHSQIANLPTKYGEFKIKAYKDGSQEHLTIMSLGFFEIETPFVRIHSKCLVKKSYLQTKKDELGHLL